MQLYVILVLCCICSSIKCDEDFKNIFFGCTEAPSKISCYFDQAAMFVEQSMNRTISLMTGVKLVRNGSQFISLSNNTATGLDRFTKAVLNFWRSHSVTFDLFGDQEEGRSKKRPVYVQPISSSSGVQWVDYNTHEEKPQKKPGGLLGMFNKFKKGGGGGKKFKSTFLVLLGIFGLTVPFTVKVLAVIAGKALLASNAAMLIVAGVALRKIFEHQEPKYVEEGPTIKVHTVPAWESQEEEHDRMDYGHGYNYLVYAPYNPYQGYFSYIPTH